MVGRSGKLGVAPCNHLGEHIIGNYVRCGAGCDSSDGVPEHVDPERTPPICIYYLDTPPTCDGTKEVVVWGPEFRDINGNDMWTCRSCGREFMA